MVPSQKVRWRRDIDASLPRLGSDYVDLYQIQRWDYSTPIEETLEALDEVVKSLLGVGQVTAVAAAGGVPKAQVAPA